MLTPPPTSTAPTFDDQSTMVGGAPLPDSDQTTFQPAKKSTSDSGNAIARAADDVDRTMFVPASDADSTTFAPPDADRTTFVPPEDVDKTTFTPRSAKPGEASKRFAGGDGARFSTPTTAAGGGTPATARQGGPLAVGQSFGARYHIIRILGVGGMGAVYQAWDSELGVAVAIKVVRPEVTADPTSAADMERRFKRELLLARQVTHKNVVRIHDMGEIDGIKYITMPYVEGADLATVLREQGRLPIPRTLRIIRSVVSGMAAAHAAGVVHRDLKPANIMLDGADEALVMDFGIARSTGMPTGGKMPGETTIVGNLKVAMATPEATVMGAVVGTVEYMAPEQAKGIAVDQRADVYALGLILYDMLAGRSRAAIAKNPIAELKARMEQAPPAIKSIVAEVPDPVNALVSRCLEPDPAKRFQTTAELAAEFERLDENGEFIPVKRVVGLPTMIAVVALVVTLLGSTWWYFRARKPIEHEAMPVLITDFDNRTNDPAFDGVLERTLAIGIEGASFITSYDRNAARKDLAQLGRATKLDETTSQLVAKREGLKVVLAGEIEARGGGYSIGVKGIDPADGKVLWTKTESARGKADVLGAIGSLSADVRKALGDTTSKAAQMAPTETITTASLEAVQNFSLAQDLLYAGKYPEAIQRYQAAIQQDQSFGRAYAALATAQYSSGQRTEAEQSWKKALSLMDRMTEREKFRTLAIYYARIEGNFEKAKEVYTDLATKYPSDWAAHGNLGGVHFLLLEFPQALEETRKAVKLAPHNVLYRNNSILLAMYASEFANSVKEAEAFIKEEPGFFKNYLPLAVAAIDEGNFDSAAEAYTKMAATGPAGASLAEMGRADLAMYRGRYAEAEQILTKAIASDQQAKDTAALMAKQIALAETFAAVGKMPQALNYVRDALKTGPKELSVLAPAARLLVRAGKPAEAAELAADLDNKLQTQPRAYAKIIDGNIALLNRRRASALDAFKESIKLADFWMARFDLGMVYVQAEHYAEGLAELELCQKRRGEAVAIFLDEEPTYRYLSALPYWLGRAQEGVGQQAAAVVNYKKFISLKPESPNDPLVVDARKRAGL